MYQPDEVLVGESGGFLLKSPCNGASSYNESLVNHDNGDCLCTSSPKDSDCRPSEVKDNDAANRQPLRPRNRRER